MTENKPIEAHGRAPLPGDTPQDRERANWRAPLQVQRLVRWLSARPTLWNIFRRVLEFNFVEERRVIKRELMPAATRVKRQGRAPIILDLGCGTGELAPGFLRAGYSYIGIDIEPERIEYARKTFRKGKFHVMDATDLRYPDGYFDQILITGVLHHLSDEEVRRIVAEMKRVLRPEGLALVMEDIALRGSLNLWARRYTWPTRRCVHSAVRRSTHRCSTRTLR